MLIKGLEVGQLGTNCYIITDENTLDCAIIDPGAESGTILNYLEENKLTCRAIMLTHAHFDHVMALAKVKEATGAAVYVNKLEENLGAETRAMTFKAPEGSVFYDDGFELSVSGLKFKILGTPGHTPGGVTIMCENSLFTGDTLFRGSCGRTDFPGGDMMEEMRSLKKLAVLEGDYDVYPGHGEYSTMSFERAYNPYVIRALQM